MLDLDFFCELRNLVGNLRRVTPAMSNLMAAVHYSKI
jgi:hypothetical protein